jgi:hypothetical protein
MSAPGDRESPVHMLVCDLVISGRNIFLEEVNIEPRTSSLKWARGV